ncbi:MAG: hypothetical protein M3Z84_01960 [Actinomycetota bacterium]|nr:hypothetical protein [Actinomycetota bacterium]
METRAATGRGRGGSTGKIPGELCDVCGQETDPATAYKAELTVSGAMCPSPMNFHPECYEKAAYLWQPDPDSYCTVDPLYPETGQWTSPSPEGTQA